jgi:transaldolase
VGVGQVKALRPGVFLDRDGVINRTTVRGGVPCPPASVDEVEILPGVAEALQRLAGRGLPLIVVTNQPDVARGTQTAERVEAINRLLAQKLPITAVYTCYHDSGDNCDCRKPKPGMLIRAAGEHGIDLSRSFMVGDRWADVEAGRAVGCKTFLIELPYSHGHRCTPDSRVADLAEAAGQVLRMVPDLPNNPVPGAAPRPSTMTFPPPDLRSLRVKIFADGADRASMVEMARKPFIAGLTTNPTLMRKAGVADYRAFARDVLKAIPDKPISFEVFCDDFAGMERQANEIAAWGDNVYVKVPVTNCSGEPAYALIKRLARAGVKQNVTALMALGQVRDVSSALGDAAASYVSVFAGRVADTGRDPVPLMAAAVELMRPFPNQQLIWASPRELLNIFHADAVGCHVITVTHDVLKRLALIGKDLAEYSLETVKMFHDDAKGAGYSL